MATQIKAWQVANGTLRPVNTTLEEQGRKEAEHLEQWIVSTSEVLGEDVLLIGRQVQTRSGPLDLLAVDRAGNTVIIELKRGLVAREVLAQAIDYASDIASWTPRSRAHDSPVLSFCRFDHDAQQVDTNCPFQFQKRSQLFIRSRNKMFTVAAMRVSSAVY